MDASVVVVNYDSGHRLAVLLEQLADLPIVVVDNASADGSEIPAEGRPGTTLLRNEDNLGFAAAANQGTAFVHSEWVVFVNPDTSTNIVDIERLLDGLPDDVGAVAPVQVDGRGRVLEETGGHDPSLARFAAWAMLPRRLRRDRGPWLGAIPDLDFSPDWVSGATLAVRRRAFGQLHGFDTRLFLYLEDADLCRRLRTAGWRIMCRPGIRVAHEVGQDDPERRTRQVALFVETLGSQESGLRRRMLGGILALGYALRAPAQASAREGFRAALGLLRREQPG